MADAHKNFAYSTITGTASVGDNNDPGTNGTVFYIASGDYTYFPAVPFNATIWPTGKQPTSTNAEIVRVTAMSNEKFTISRQQEGTAVRNILHTDQIAAAITAKTMVDAENPITSWSPYVLNGSNSATGLQTLASTIYLTGGTNSLYVFPVTIPGDIAFNQILLANSISFSLSASSNATEVLYNTHYSMFGLYSMMANSTALSLISSSSFSIGETYSNSSYLTWNFPTTTATSGYGYGSLQMSSAQIANYLFSTRAVGMQFGGNMNLGDGVYWLGLLSFRSSAAGQRTALGLSHAGVIGQIINTINWPATSTNTVGGMFPLGVAGSAWTANNANSTQWFGKHIIGFLTNTARAGFGGTKIPDAVTLSEIYGAYSNSTNVTWNTILPAVTFVST